MPDKGGKGASGRLTPKQKSQQKSTAASGVPQSAADFLAQLGGSGYGAAAANIYAPQFDYLNQQTAQTQANYGRGDAKLQSLYGNLVQSIRGDRGQIRNDYGSAINDNNSNTSSGIRNIDNIYANSQAKEAALLQQLGIQAAAPDVFQRGTHDRSMYEGSLASNGAAYGNQLNSQRANSLNFNRDQQNISKQMGTEKRADLQTALQNALTQLAGQRASLQSQERQSAYSMQNSAAQQAYAQQKDQAARDLALTKLQLQYGPQSAAGQKAAQGAGPGGALAHEAQLLYPQSTDAQQNAIKAITDTLATYGSNMPRNVNDFVQTVLHRNPHATDVQQLTDLAQLMFKQLGFTNPRPLV